MATTDDVKDAIAIHKEAFRLGAEAGARAMQERCAAQAWEQAGRVISAAQIRAIDPAQVAKEAVAG